MGSKAKVIILTASEDKNEFVQAMKLGCSGIVLKQTSAELIVKSIRKVHSGEIWLDSHTTAAVMRQFASPLDPSPSGQTKVRERSPLSAREREIVALVAQGYKNKEMAEKMFISEQTVKNHLHNIFDKLGVPTGWNSPFTPFTKVSTCSSRTNSRAASRTRGLGLLSLCIPFLAQPCPH